MKKRLLLFAVCCFAAFQTALAIPAKPGPIVVTQPDGSQITIQLFGDEFYNYKTSIDGYQIQQLEDGFYYYYTPAMASTRSVAKAASVRVNDPQNRTKAERQFLSTIYTGVNAEFEAAARQVEKERRTLLAENFKGLAPQMAKTRAKQDRLTKGLVILAQFSDVKFQDGHGEAAFNDLLSKKGYSKENAIGCVSDYFEHCSQGQFVPDFKVGAVVTLDQKLEYYGADPLNGSHDARPAQLIVDACTAADDQVDFSEYDGDGDGILDFVFVVYAGYSEAEGASSDAIWPHRWVVNIPGNASGKGEYDGVKLQDYACTAELRGNEGSTTMAGIGVFCHEFGHVLGLPDYYDTDYSGTNGSSVGLYGVSVMSSGGYNEDGSVPPSYGPIEKLQIGWSTLKDLSELPNGEVTVNPWVASNKNTEIYFIPTEEEGEIFMLESRAAEGWDEPLDGSGLIITQWDNKEYKNPKESFAYKNTENTVNIDPYHMYVRYRESYGMAINGRSPRLSQIAYPGERKKDSFSAGSYGFISWGGETLPIALNEIKDNNGVVTFMKEAASNEPAMASSITQNTAKVVFLRSGSNAWSIKYRTDGGDWKQRSSIMETSVILTKLAPGSEYECVITNSDDEEFELSFTTLPLTGATSVIANIESQYKLGDSYTPSVINISDPYDAIEWTVNNEGTDSNGDLKFTATGKSAVRCRIIYSDGSVEVLTKEVNVK